LHRLVATFVAVRLKQFERSSTPWRRGGVL